jgi:hypothetical protein
MKRRSLRKMVGLEISHDESHMLRHRTHSPLYKLTPAMQDTNKLRELHDHVECGLAVLASDMLARNQEYRAEATVVARGLYWLALHLAHSLELSDVQEVEVNSLLERLRTKLSEIGAAI